jgi:hypothetical protein
VAAVQEEALMLRFSFRGALSAALFVLLTSISHATDQKLVIFPLENISSAILTTNSEASALVSSETEAGGKVYQVFRDKKTGQERFRVDIGSHEVKWWNYGIRADGDFNRDGRADYLWYGGDDTSEVLYVFLSHGSGYRRLDVFRTMKKDWARRFPAIPVPDFDSVDFAPSGSGEIVDISLMRTFGMLRLQLHMKAAVPGSGQMKTYILDIPESRFVISR